MCDLATTIPRFPTTTFAHLIPALDRSGVTVSDLICCEPLELSRRALLPPDEITRLSEALVKALQEESRCDALPLIGYISCLDRVLDEALGGGFPVGYLSEVTGESGAGKTQFLLTLMLAVQLLPPHGLSKSAIYISTEAGLSTPRLSQLLKSHPLLQALSVTERPSLARIHSIQTPDLESQDHILRFQVPVAIERYDVGLVIIDSIAANYRAELHEEMQTLGHTSRTANGFNTRSGISLAERRTMLVSIGSHLRRLAKEKNIAIVVANQVADRFMPDQQVNNSQQIHASSTSNTQRTDTPSTPVPQTPSVSNLDHQQRFFTGWGDYTGPFNPNDDEEIDHILANPARWKTPALGLVWANQIAGRVALIREPLSSSHILSPEQNRDEDGWGVAERRRRFLRVPFASWTRATGTAERGVEYEITGAGLRGILTRRENGIGS